MLHAVVSWYSDFGNFVTIEVYCKPRCTFITSLAISLPVIPTKRVLEPFIAKVLVIHQMIHDLYELDLDARNNN